MQPLIKPFSDSRLLAPAQLNSSEHAKLPLSLKVILFTLFLPVESSFYVLGLRLTVIRFLFLILTPMLLIKVTRKVSSGSYHFVPSDLFVVLASFWMIYAPSMIDGILGALNHAGPEVLEFCIGYMTTRVLLSRHGQAMSFIDLFCRITAVVALLGLLDSLTNYYVVHGMIGQMTGYNSPIFYWDDAHRLGILRATGPVEHPILFGFICGICLIFAASAPIRWRLFVMISCSLGAIFSFSSAPIQCILMGLALLIYNRMMKGVPFRWLTLIAIGSIAIILAFMISNSPVGFIVSHLIFSPSSGWYRVWTWDRVIYYVSQSPWYGLGFGVQPDDINHSIDSLWLVLAIHYGLPGVVLIALSIIGAAFVPTRSGKRELTSAERRLATTIGIVIFLTIFIAFTVDFWGISWILVSLIMGIGAHLGELGRLRTVSARSAPGFHTARALPRERRSIA
jgi:hypothetical protein